jgi:hypothetical protein
VVVEIEDYAMQLGGYIERNAVRAGLVKDPGDWKRLEMVSYYPI